MGHFNALELQIEKTPFVTPFQGGKMESQTDKMLFEGLATRVEHTFCIALVSQKESV